MAGTDNAAAGGQQQQIDLAAITKSVTEGVLASLKPTIDGLTSGQTQLTAGFADLIKNQKTIADTLAQLPPAAAAGEGKGKGAEQPKLLTAEDVTKIVTETFAKAQQAQQQTQAQQTALANFIASPESGLAKIATMAKSMGIDLAARLGADPAKWAAEAKAIVGGFESFAKDAGIKIPDVGNASKDGGTTAGQAAQQQQQAGKYDWVKMPGTPGNPAATGVTQAAPAQAAPAQAAAAK